MLNDLSAKVEIDKSKLIRGIFKFFDENLLKLLIILEEIKKNE